MPERDDRELALLVRARLEARQPRHLPERFQPPAPRVHGRRWAALTVAAAIVLGLAAATAVRPDLRSAVLSGLVDRLPGVHAGQPGAPAPARPGGGGRPARPSGPSPGRGAGGAGGGSGTVAPPRSTPVPSGGGSSTPPPLPVSIPSLPPLPVPTPSLPPVPVPTPSLPLVI